MTLDEINKEIIDLRNDLLRSREEINSVILKSKIELNKLEVVINRINSLFKSYRSDPDIWNQRTISSDIVKYTSAELEEILKVENYQIGSYNLNTSTHLLTRGNSIVRLTNKEMNLLALLATNQNKIINRSHLLFTIWGDDSYLNGRSMDVYLCKIRKLLKDDNTINLVNIPDRGYNLMVY